MSHALVQDDVVVKHPYTFDNLRADNPQISFPRDPSDTKLAEFGVVKVAWAEQPGEPARGKKMVEGTPVKIKGVWTQAWVEVDASADEIAARDKREADAAARSAVKADQFVANFVAMTPAEVEDYVSTSVTNLASAKSVITKLSLMVLLLARREFRD